MCMSAHMCAGAHACTRVCACGWAGGQVGQVGRMGGWAGGRMGGVGALEESVHTVGRFELCCDHIKRFPLPLRTMHACARECVRTPLNMHMAVKANVERASVLAALSSSDRTCACVRACMRACVCASAHACAPSIRRVRGMRACCMCLPAYAHVCVCLPSRRQRKRGP